MILSEKDAIYVTSWAAYNEGRAAGGWYILADLADLTTEEIMEEFKKTGLDPYGRDEELVVHDYDDYTGIGYYKLFGEPYPTRVVDLYRQLQVLDDEEVLVFIGLNEDQGSEIALLTLKEDALDEWGVQDEDSFRDFALEIAESYVEANRTEELSDFIDRDMIRRDIEQDFSYDEDDEDDEDDVDYSQDYIEEEIDIFIRNLDKERLTYYLDLDDFMRYLANDYFDFEYEGTKYYLYQ